ncbi:FUSC family protein [Nitratifractor sp.]|uniref:FUSC family protein n=1 Tax=Nitratifractor sp. TaxID=2268144 RepID=UPI0025E86A76|nr:FUSC family protein [Nitratifractor sp.]
MSTAVFSGSVANGGAMALLPSLPPRVRFAAKTALAITLSYLGAMAMQWSQPYQGPVAVMVIASAGPLRESLGKGVMRVVGTVIGALLGLLFLALFPQDTTLYFLALTLAGGVITYLYYAWQGDKSFWLIMLLVMVLLYNYGYVDDRLIYAVDRSWSTAFGIFVYAVLNLYLWPEKSAQSRVAQAAELARHWQSAFDAVQHGEEEAEATLPQLEAAEKAMERSLRVGATEYPGGIAFDRYRWESLWEPILRIDRHLGMLALMRWGRVRERMERLFPETELLRREIGQMMGQFERFWAAPFTPEVPPRRHVELSRSALETLPALERAEMLSLTEELQRLHEGLRTLLERLARILSPEPDPVETFSESRKSPRRFHWGDPEDLKAALTGMLVFWTGLGFWYLMPTDLGYMVPAMAFALSLLILFTPLNPLALIFIYTLSFAVSFLTYVFVLPVLSTWWELGLYFFLYMFAAYYFIPTALSLFFGLGLVFQFIDNTTFFSVQLFVTVLLLFYLFLGLLLIFNYLPFSNRPKDLFLRLERRFRELSRALSGVEAGHKAWRVWQRWALAQLPVTAAKMRLWASKLDRHYFDRLDEKALERYLRSAQLSAEIITLLDPLRRRLSSRGLLGEFEAVEKEVWSFLSKLRGMELDKARRLAAERGRELDARLRRIDWQAVGRQTLGDLARYVTLRKRLIESLIEGEAARRKAGLEQLKWSRF